MKREQMTMLSLVIMRCCLFFVFCRTCKLSNSNLPMASVDILYIDIARRWNIIRGERGESGNFLFFHSVSHC